VILRYFYPLLVKISGLKFIFACAIPKTRSEFCFRVHEQKMILGFSFSDSRTKNHFGIFVFAFVLENLCGIFILAAAIRNLPDRNTFVQPYAVCK
jgi:hypothetical protein